MLKALKFENFYKYSVAAIARFNSIECHRHHGCHTTELGWLWPAIFICLQLVSGCTELLGGMKKITEAVLGVSKVFDMCVCVFEMCMCMCVCVMCTCVCVWGVHVCVGCTIPHPHMTWGCIQPRSGHSLLCICLAMTFNVPLRLCVCVCVSVRTRAATIYLNINILQYWLSQYDINTSYYNVNISKYWYIAIISINFFFLKGIHFEGGLKSQIGVTSTNVCNVSLYHNHLTVAFFHQRAWQ